ncbi:MAG: hypothetical protein CME75_02755 [Halomonas sp.]|nr:hypothetical protein [Halomonas sp.]
MTSMGTMAKKFKSILIHVLTHIEKYQLLVIGLLALLWNFQSDKDWPEPLVYFLSVVFAAVALKKIIVKGNVDEELQKIIARSNPISDWHTNEQFSENEHIAVYRKDPSIKLVRYTDAVVEGFQEDWLDGLYPDPRASSYNVSIQYNGNEVMKRIILLVDGARVFLPLPKSPKTLETNEFDLAICQILNGQTGYDTAYYFKQSKMVLNKEKLDQKNA